MTGLVRAELPARKLTASQHLSRNLPYLESSKTCRVHISPAAQKQPCNIMLGLRRKVLRRPKFGAIATARRVFIYYPVWYSGARKKKKQARRSVATLGAPRHLNGLCAENKYELGLPQW